MGKELGLLTLGTATWKFRPAAPAFPFTWNPAGELCGVREMTRLFSWYADVSCIRLGGVERRFCTAGRTPLLEDGFRQRNKTGGSSVVELCFSPAECLPKQYFIRFKSQEIKHFISACILARI